MSVLSARPRVSVVIATRERAAYLERALDSVASQTFRDLEVVLVDDGSTDETPAVAARFPGRLRYLRQPRRGRSHARNAGIASARGEYVAFLDDDDLWAPTKLERQVRFLDRHPDACVVHTFTRIVDEAGRPLAAETERRLADHRAGFRIGYGYAALARLCIIFSSSVVARRAGIQDVRFDPDFDVFEDWDFYLRVARAGRIAALPEPLTLYRFHRGNTAPADFTPARIRIARKHLDLLETGDGDPVARFWFTVQLAHAHYIAGDMPQARASALAALWARPRAALGAGMPRRVLLTLVPQPVRAAARRARAAHPS